MLRNCFLAISVLLLQQLLLPAEENPAWEYVIPEAGEAVEHAPLQPLRLAEEKPEEVRERARYRGTKRLYGLVRYGSPDSKRVVVVVDEIGRQNFDLYVDASRDWVIEDGDRVDGEGAFRRARLKAELTGEDDVVEYLERWVIVRRGLSSGSLGWATRGYLEGEVRLGERTLGARRVDGDGNGLFADSRDRVLVDLNEDGRFDPFSEQFPFLPVLPLNGSRYALRSDAIGQRLELQEIVGTGTVRLKLATLRPETRVLELDAMLIGEDGSAFAIRGSENAVSVPVGRYAFGTVTLRLEHPETKIPWSFVFSRNAAPRDGRWYDVHKDEEIVADPIGTLRFELQIPEAAAGFAPGETVSIQPRLYTQDGLLINSCVLAKEKFSNYEQSTSAAVRLVGARGAVLDSYSSGFA